MGSQRQRFAATLTGDRAWVRCGLLLLQYNGLSPSIPSRFYRRTCNSVTPVLTRLAGNDRRKSLILGRHRQQFCPLSANFVGPELVNLMCVYQIAPSDRKHGAGTRSRLPL
jgi:hypothetical protein